MKKTRVFLALLALLVLLSFYVFSREVKRGFLHQVDFDTTVRLQAHIPARFDGMWNAITFFVEPTPSVFVVGLLTIAALIDFKKKKLRWKALIIPLLFGALVLGELYGKSVVHHPSPPFFMIKNPTTVFPQFYVNEQYSYPSGHTARATFFGFVIYSLLTIRYSLIKRKKQNILAALVIIGFICMVAIGKIYLGHHWLSDVIGGGLLGAAISLLALGLIC